MTRIVRFFAVLAIVAAMVGCSLDRPGVPLTGDGADASPVGDGCWTWQPEHIDPCLLEAPGPELVLNALGTYTYDTTSGVLRAPDTAVLQHTSQVLDPYRVISVEGLTVNDLNRLRVTGERPLLIASTADIHILGVIDASSNDGNAGAGANPSECDGAGPTVGMDDNGGAGGGGGGAFAGNGGDGGNGDSNEGESAGGQGGRGLTAIPTTVRGGCPGASGGDGYDGVGGQGGIGGGAIELISQTGITIDNGLIRASGQGGHGGPSGDNGGGGGGSGGFVALDAPKIALQGAMLVANGGGGGEGASGAAGRDGESGQDDSAPASGGAGGTSNGTDGGAGGFADLISGQSPGEPRASGAGGGGGGVGYVLVFTEKVDADAGNITSPRLIDMHKL